MARSRSGTSPRPSDRTHCQIAAPLRYAPAGARWRRSPLAVRRPAVQQKRACSRQGGARLTLETPGERLSAHASTVQPRLPAWRNNRVAPRPLPDVQVVASPGWLKAATRHAPAASSAIHYFILSSFKFILCNRRASITLPLGCPLWPPCSLCSTDGARPRWCRFS